MEIKGVGIKDGAIIWNKIRTFIPNLRVLDRVDTFDSNIHLDSLRKELSRNTCHFCLPCPIGGLK